LRHVRLDSQLQEFRLDAGFEVAQLLEELDVGGLALGFYFVAREAELLQEPEVGEELLVGEGGQGAQGALGGGGGVVGVGVGVRAGVALRGGRIIGLFLMVHEFIKIVLSFLHGAAHSR
jgi:hypothetical protein